MVRNHLKRLSSPNSWPLPKKTLTFVARSHPGGHKKDMQIPLVVALRDMIGVVENKKQANILLKEKDCLVDQKTAHDIRRPVGFMDVISLKKSKEDYRILLNDKKKLSAVKISQAESKKKVLRIINKTTLKGSITQLNTSDGRCVRVDDTSKYSVGDSIVISIPDQKIISLIRLEKGATVLLMGGSHAGEIGIVEHIESAVIRVKTKDQSFMTKKEYAIVVGKDKPVITLN
ncbi:MAG: 30S ribosomal protein S4e [Nanobdellota archaeon]